MKNFKKKLSTLIALPLIISAFSASASAHDINHYEWVKINKNQTGILAKNIANSDGLIVTCAKKSIVVDVADLYASKGEVVQYWTESSKGSFKTRHNGMVSTQGNGAQTVVNFLTDLVLDNAITFMVENEIVTYSLKGSAKAIKALKGCGLRNT